VPGKRRDSPCPAPNPDQKAPPEAAPTALRRPLSGHRPESATKGDPLGEPHPIGFAGLLHQTFEAAFTPAFEIGYRLAKHAWGLGYATEAAREAVRFGFERAGLDEIVSMTAVGNVRSRAVMDKLGMTHDLCDDFDHPRVPDGHPLKRHVLYRLTRRHWQAAHGPAAGERGGMAAVKGRVSAASSTLDT
jgi:RimJ/RimL family protein N-acetyltransferase